MKVTRGRVAAFTLIELIVTIVIVGVLAALAAVAYNAFIDNARRQAALSVASQVATLYQAESSLSQVPLALTPSGADTSFIYAWDGRGLNDPPEPAEVAAANRHAGLAADVAGVEEVSAVYMLRSGTGTDWISSDPSRLPAGHDILVMERAESGVCWADFGPSPVAGASPISVDCEL